MLKQILFHQRIKRKDKRSGHSQQTGYPKSAPRRRLEIRVPFTLPTTLVSAGMLQTNPGIIRQPNRPLTDKDNQHNPLTKNEPIPAVHNEFAR